MIIQQNRGEGRSINAEDLFIRNIRSKFWIQGMNTLYHQYFVTLQLQFFSTPLALAFLKVIARQLYLLASEQCRKLLVKQRQIQGMQVLKIVIALIIFWRLLAVEEIIIQRDTHRMDTIHSQLHTKTLTGGGFTRRRRTGYQHQFNTLALSYLIGYISNLLFLQCLAYLYKLRRMTIDNRFVQITNGAQS